jgi:uncharacterized protein (TIGR00297 family)
VVYGLGNARFLAPLLVFFISSSALSRVGRQRKLLISGRHDAKGDSRDAGQVWANGGVAVCCVLAFSFGAHRLSLIQLRTLLMLYLAALATVNADTWATEIGKLSRKAPRLLTNFRSVSPGVSGAISALGTAGAFGGALIIPLLAIPVLKLNVAEVLAITWAGFLGSLCDSILGATLQAQYRSAATGELTERRQIDGKSATRVRGLAWVNNDVVNFIASAGGVLFAWLLLKYGVYRFYF